MRGLLLQPKNCKNILLLLPVYGLFVRLFLFQLLPIKKTRMILASAFVFVYVANHPQNVPSQPGICTCSQYGECQKLKRKERTLTN